MIRYLDIQARRCAGNPLISGDNVNGPSVIRVPDWIQKPLGRYYMYYGDHAGDRIHLAFADDLEGPWTTYQPGTLTLDDASAFEGHIASPDVHVDHDEQRIRMYFHGKAKGREGQFTGVAMSSDGIQFTAADDFLGKFYFRVFEYKDFLYAIAKDWNSGWGELYRSADGVSNFESGGRIMRRVRHTALKRVNDTLLVFYSRKGDAPERILYTTINLKKNWRRWKPGVGKEVLRPEMLYEGIQYPNLPSRYGSAVEVQQLRDPCIFEEEGRTFLFYSIAGEMGIAMAELEISFA